MVTESPPQTKSASQSWTVRFNGVLIGLAAVLATLPDAVNAPPFSVLVSASPPHARHVLALVVALISAANITIRIFRTAVPIGRPSSPPT